MLTYIEGLTRLMFFPHLYEIKVLKDGKLAKGIINKCSPGNLIPSLLISNVVLFQFLLQTVSVDKNRIQLTGNQDASTKSLYYLMFSVFTFLKVIKVSIVYWQ